MPKKKKKVSRSRRVNKLTYRSGLEDSIGNFLTKQGVKYEYEKEKIKYIIPESSHIYTPDFSFKASDGHTIYIEGKGIWEYSDRYKHLLLKRQYGDRLDIRFIFTRSKSRITKESKTTYADICEGLGRGPFRGVRWRYADKQIPREWLKE
jgi:predicted nuclease of restriction endonuclease-like RecB superfamily